MKLYCKHHRIQYFLDEYKNIVNRGIHNKSVASMFYSSTTEFKSYILSFVCLIHSLSQVTLHHWPSFGKGENKGSVLLWYSCFDRFILMFLMREGLQSQISILKHCRMRLWIDINQLTFVFPFAETRSVDVNWPRECFVLLQQARESKPAIERVNTPVFNSVVVKKTRVMHDDDNKR